jgi:hypothetical protein
VAYRIVSKKVPDLGDVTVQYHDAVAGGANPGLGCFSNVLKGLGGVSVVGVSLNGKAVGDVNPKMPGYGMASYSHSVTPKMTKVPPEVIQDMIYSDLVTLLNYGSVIIFGDRINRGTTASPVQSVAHWGAEVSSNVTFTPAAFANWLKDKPEHGMLVASPVFNNRNHRGARDFGMIQVWLFFPTRVVPYMYVDHEDGFLYPDTNLPTKEKFVEAVKESFLVGETTHELLSEAISAGKGVAPVGTDFTKFTERSYQ